MSSFGHESSHFARSGSPGSKLDARHVSGDPDQAGEDAGDTWRSNMIAPVKEKGEQ